MKKKETKGREQKKWKEEDRVEDSGLTLNDFHW